MCVCAEKVSKVKFPPLLEFCWEGLEMRWGVYPLLMTPPPSLGDSVFSSRLQLGGVCVTTGWCSGCEVCVYARKVGVRLSVGLAIEVLLLC